MGTRPRTVTGRSVLLSAVIIIGTSYWLGYTEMIWHITHLSTIAVPVNVLFVVLMLGIFNTLTRRFAPSAALRQTELLTVYSMVATGSAFSGHDFLPRLMGLLPHAFRYASVENDWGAVFFQYLPRWLLIDEPSAVRAFYEGDANFFSDGYWRVWVGPTIAWAVVILAIMLTSMAVTVLLREQWVRRERLAYPLTQIPFMVTSEGTGLFAARRFWMGFVIGAGLMSWNGVEWFIPALPHLPLRDWEISRHIPIKPWNAIGNTEMRIHPLLIGIGYLLPLDISSSVVVFYVLRKALMVIGAAVGVRSVPGYPFLGEQGAGALFAVLTIALWTGREHLGRVASALWRPNQQDVGDQPMSYRAAVVLSLTCGLVMLVVCLRAGMTGWGCLLFLGTYLTIVVGLTRIRAELGPPIHAVGYATPQYLLVSLFGTRRLGPGNLTVLSLLNWLSGSNFASFRTHAMPHQMEAFKLADRAGIRSRSMLWALVLAGGIGIAAGLVMYPAQIYGEGVSPASEQINFSGSDTYTFLASWLQFPKPADTLGVAVLSAAWALSLGIYAVRSRVTGFWLHPAGYVIGIAPGNADQLWFPLLVAVGAKWVVLKAGGFRLYRRGVAFFVGLASGEAVAIALWSLVSLVTRRSIYSWW